MILPAIVAFVLFTTVNAQDQAKKDSTAFNSEYKKQKFSFITELKKDSFLVTEQYLSKEFSQGRIEVAPGIYKRHFTKAVRTMETWRYPDFDTKLFEAWMDKKSSTPGPTSEK